jgi:hypothetical protein
MNTTIKKIGTLYYHICSAPAENATETLEKKIERLIKKDIEKNVHLTRKIWA